MLVRGQPEVTTAVINKSNYKGKTLMVTLLTVTTKTSIFTLAVLSGSALKTSIVQNQSD